MKPQSGSNFRTFSALPFRRTEADLNPPIAPPHSWLQGSLQQRQRQGRLTLPLKVIPALVAKNRVPPRERNPFPPKVRLRCSALALK